MKLSAGQHKHSCFIVGLLRCAFMGRRCVCGGVCVRPYSVKSDPASGSAPPILAALAVEEHVQDNWNLIYSPEDEPCPLI